MSSIDVLLADDNVADARLAAEAMDLSTLSAWGRRVIAPVD